MLLTFQILFSAFFLSFESVDPTLHFLCCDVVLAGIPYKYHMFVWVIEVLGKETGILILS